MWKSYKLGELATFINGYAFKPSDWGRKGLPIIRIQNLTKSSNEINYYDGVIDGKYIISNGDILISWSASLGVYEWNEGNAVLNQHIFKVVFDKVSVDKKFFVYLIKKELENMIKNTHGSTMKHITKKRFDDLSVKLPPLQTQKKIVEVLDKAQALIDARKEQIRLLDDLIQSTFYDMFGDPVTNPKRWENKVLDDVAIKITDGTHHSPKSQTSGVPYITAKHLNKNEIDFYSNPTYVSEEAHKAIYSRCNPEYGDVLYIKDGATTGIAAINKYTFEFSMLSSLALIKVNSKYLNNYYLTSFLNNQRAKDNIIKDMSGGAIKRLTIKKIKDIEVKIPPINLQTQFAEKVQKIESQKQLMEKSLEEMENNFNSLMQRAFKGELFA